MTVVTSIALCVAMGKVGFTLLLRSVNNCLVAVCPELTKVLEADAICFNIDGAFAVALAAFTGALSVETSSFNVADAMTDVGGRDAGKESLLLRKASISDMP